MKSDHTSSCAPPANLAEPDTSAEAIENAIGKFLKRVGTSKFPHKLGKSLALGGYARIGKSILAKRFSEKAGFFHLAGDEFRKLFWEIEDDSLRDRTRRHAYIRLLQMWPNGLIFETDDLISANRGAKRGFQPFSLELLVMLRDADLADVALVVPKETDIKSRLEALKSWRETGNCWTLRTHASEDALQNLAKRAVRDEAVLRQLAHDASVRLLEIDTSDFANSIESLSSELAKTR